MSQLLDFLHTALTDGHHHILAEDPTPKGPIDNPIPTYKPSVPDAVKTPTATVLGWVAGVGLALCVLGHLGGWGAIGVGHNTENARLAARGKQAVIWSLIAAVGFGVGGSLVFAFYSMAS
ncbi:hypothetical protein ACIGZJ_36040 [Kitasatospora sp. NPDC052868]|uniref:hypothetical protein n=1 Tax=Kitasatospora sp. NPDC052868 TaxID=3364060 RepID=UPI0037C8BE77